MTRTSADDTRRPRGPFRRLYGASPWHLLVLLACFALTAYAVTRLLGELPVLLRITIWFVGAAVVWDLVLGPALALLDRALRPLGTAANYVRVPGLLSLLLLLVWLPIILQRSEGIFRDKAGLSQDPYLGRWLAITAVLFAASGAAYALARVRAGRRTATAD